jgi:hypothetical protein
MCARHGGLHALLYLQMPDNMILQSYEEGGKRNGDIRTHLIACKNASHINIHTHTHTWELSVMLNEYSTMRIPRNMTKMTAAKDVYFRLSTLRSKQRGKMLSQPIVIHSCGGGGRLVRYIRHRTWDIGHGT